MVRVLGGGRLLTSELHIQSGWLEGECNGVCLLAIGSISLSWKYILQMARMRV